jgi:hypothetical protein
VDIQAHGYGCACEALSPEEGGSMSAVAGVFMPKRKARAARNFTAPICSDCIHKLHVPFSAGYCKRRMWLDANGIPRHPRCVDERTDRCGLTKPRFFIAKEQA